MSESPYMPGPGFTGEDQLKALEAGFTSTTAWAVVELIKLVRGLEERVDKLEGGAKDLSPTDGEE